MQINSGLDKHLSSWTSISFNKIRSSTGIVFKFAFHIFYKAAIIGWGSSSLPANVGMGVKEWFEKAYFHIILMFMLIVHYTKLTVIHINVN